MPFTDSTALAPLIVALELALLVSAIVEWRSRRFTRKMRQRRQHGVRRHTSTNIDVLEGWAPFAALDAALSGFDRQTHGVPRSFVIAWERASAVTFKRCVVDSGDLNHQATKALATARFIIHLANSPNGRTERARLQLIHRQFLLHVQIHKLSELFQVRARSTCEEHDGDIDPQRAEAAAIDLKV